MKSNEKKRILTAINLLIAVLIFAVLPFQLLASGSSGGEAYLGVYTQHFNKSLQKSVEYKGYGLYVEAVERRSPADRAGIEPGDVITLVGEKKIKNKKSLNRALWKMEPGDNAEVTVMRGKKKLFFEIELGSRKQDFRGEKYWRVGTNGRKFKKTDEDSFVDLQKELENIPETLVLLEEGFAVPEEPEMPLILGETGIFEARMFAREARELARARSEYQIVVPERMKFKELEKLNKLRWLEGDLVSFPVPQETFNNRHAVD